MTHCYPLHEQSVETLQYLLSNCNDLLDSHWLDHGSSRDAIPSCSFLCPTTRLFDCRRNWQRENFAYILQDALSAFHAAYDILLCAQHEMLVRTQFSTITSASSITSILDESFEWSEEWAEKIYKVICDYQLVR